MIFLILYLAVIIVIIFIVDDDKPNKQIALNDINVNDEIMIKGEHFTVKAYSPNGNVELISLNDNMPYIVKIDNNTKLTSHSENGIRKYITIDNFEGTVSGQYLNKLKIK